MCDVLLMINFFALAFVFCIHTNLFDFIRFESRTGFGEDVIACWISSRSHMYSYSHIHAHELVNAGKCIQFLYVRCACVYSEIVTEPKPCMHDINIQWQWYNVMPDAENHKKKRNSMNCTTKVDTEFYVSWGSVTFFSFFQKFDAHCRAYWCSVLYFFFSLLISFVG